ncbi:PAS domain S-box protein [Thermosynechococcus sp. TA-1]|uniref:PAS domain S-box protein n=1 Tax=Thermosynechococcus sp. TA-1 TaxID=2813673 RepID=UPI00197DBF1A|nr:PAS domain S-box protein [Thermosynechococcus sp. TA-1]QSF48571.1 PAS domain S-box protein [Thermosynechococcus sp. TA-1]
MNSQQFSLANHLHHLPHPVLAGDRKGTILYANAAAQRLLNHASTDLAGLSVIELLSANFDLSLERFQQVLNTQTPAQWDCYDPPKQQWWQLDLTADAHGWTLTLTEITERYRHWLLQEARVNELEKWWQRFHTLTEIGQQLFWEIQGEWCYWYGDSQGVLGYPLEQLPKTLRAWQQLIYPEDQERFWQAIPQQGGATPCDLEYRLRHANGAYVWVRDRWEYRQEPPNTTTVIGVMVNIHDQKIQEMRLRESEQRYRNLVDHLPAVVYRCAIDASWTMEYLSPKFTELTGYLSSELVHNQVRSYASITHPEDSDRVDCTIHEALAKGFPFSVGYRIFCADGSERWVHEYGQGVYDVTGKAYAIEGIIVDETERIQSEQALRESEYRWRAVFENAQVGIIVTSPANHYRLVYCNPFFCQFVGYTAPELANLTAHDLTFAEDWPDEAALIQECQLGLRNTYQIVKRYRHKKGHTVWGNLTLSCVRNANGEPHLLIALIDDITSQRQLQLALDRERNRYEQLVNNCPVIILTLNRDKTLLTSNWVGLKTLAAAQVVPGMPFSALLHPQESVTRVEALIDRVLDRETINDEEILLRCRTDAPCDMLSHLFPLLDEEEEIVGCVVVCTDISDRKRALAELDEREAQYRSVFESVADGLVIYDTENLQIVEVNDAICDIYGFSRSECLELQPEDFLHPDYRNQFQEFLETIRHQPTWHGVSKHRCSDGQVIDVDIFATRLRYKGKNQVLCVIRDITQIKRFEETQVAIAKELSRREALFRNLINDLDVGVMLLSADLYAKVINPRGCELLGVKEADIIGQKPTEMAWDALNDAGEPMPPAAFPLMIAIAQKQRVQGVMGILNQQTQQRLWLQVTADPEVTATGSIEQVILTFSDISDRKHYEAYLQDQAVRQRELNQLIQEIREAPDLNQAFAKAVQQVCHILRVDRAIVVKYEPEQHHWIPLVEFLNKPYITPSVGLTIPDEHNPIAATLHQGKIAELPALENLDPTDAVNRAIAQVLGGGWLIAPIRINQQIWGAFSFQRFNYSSGWTDEERQLILSLTDQLAITIQQTNLYDSLQLANAELSRLATIDGLTQIANRRYFDQDLQQQWQLAQREQTNISLILCDVDFFKNFNDHYGHQAGDDCLIAIAKILTQAVRRPTDLAARYGGEEFALILPNTDLTGSLCVAERIQQLLYALEIPHMASSVSDRVTLSMGIVSLLPQVGQPVNEFITLADQQLYLAKRGGRDRYCYA